MDYWALYGDPVVIKDESFFTDDEMDRMSPNWRYIHDFDHHFLRKLGLPCGADAATEHYALLKEIGGWKVWRVRDLVNNMFTDEEWKAFRRTVK